MLLQISVSIISHITLIVILKTIISQFRSLFLNISNTLINLLIIFSLLIVEIIWLRDLSQHLIRCNLLICIRYLILICIMISLSVESISLIAFSILSLISTLIMSFLVFLVFFLSIVIKSVDFLLIEKVNKVLNWCPFLWLIYTETV